MAKLKILKVCATETATFFGNEIVDVPGQVDEPLAQDWVDEKVADWVEETVDQPKSPKKGKAAKDTEKSDKE
mgnify:CR=1 FL=1|jgi:hypothetical protein